ncbi:MAG: PilZ domain-containing protein [Candidatus Zixiibacteriota bacterium]|nr:MAG: PilZ domain-containing protein [candidate division Zixibacteria bacterium]
MTAPVTDIIGDRTCGFDIDRLDLSRLVGHHVKVFSAQFPGKEISARVVAVNGSNIELERTGGHGMMGNLVTNQQIVLQFPYQSQDVSVKANFRRTDGGRCLLTLDKHVVPMSQRRFLRVRKSVAVKLATFPQATSRLRGLSDLRWIGTDTVNVSSGGVMVSLPSHLQRDVLLLLHLETNELDFPPLLLGRVCHCFQADNGGYRAGVEFLVREVSKELLPASRRSLLPLAVFRFTATMRETLNKIICGWQDAGPANNSGE